MAPIIIVSVFIVVLFFLLHGTPKVPPVETEKELVHQGYSIKEQKRELRAQRGEHRAQKRLVNDSIRTAKGVSRLAKTLLKKR